MSSLITLTTDFGIGSTYVAQMKGVVLGIHPAANIIDITHAVPPQDVRAGAIALREATPHFPVGSIHVAVVDPGVGTRRELLYAEFGGRRFLAPDNGLLSLLGEPQRIIRIDQMRPWREVTSSTFHGRDILAPLAAHLSLGLDPATIGALTNDMVRLDLPIPRREGHEVAGQITHIDPFGNLITNIHRNALDGALPQSVRFGQHLIRPFVATYGERAPGEVVALFGSNGYLEVAVVNGSAAVALGASENDPVIVLFSVPAAGE
jgi:S-adenosylmethionine hydrolase